MSASYLPQCGKCGSSKGPWRPSGDVLPSGEQVLVCSTGCPDQLAAAVAVMGALPMPVGGGGMNAPMTPEQIRAELTAEFVAWLVKKAREHRAQGPQYAKQADLIGLLASKVQRGAVRPNNLLSLPAQGGPEDVPSLLAEVERLQTRVDELEGQHAAVLALHRKHDDSEHCFADDETWPCNTRTALSPDAPRLASPWERAVAGLNALVDAGVPFCIEPDGHISGPVSDEHIEWDQKGSRWVLTHDDEDVDPHNLPRRSTAEFVAFSAVEKGDRLRFVTADNGYGGAGEVWRTGTVAQITARTVVVECDSNLLGDTAVLRHAEWGSRSVRRAPAEDPHDSPLHRTYALGHDLPEVTADEMTADEWNARYPVGTPVVAYPLTRPEEGNPSFFKQLNTVTRTPAWTLGDGAACVSVEGYAGGIHLTHVDPADLPEVAS